MPAHHRPWHSQHPSVINNNRLLETLKDQKSIFSDGGESFDPKSTPWFTHWLVAFAVRQTVLTADEICVLYIYKYRNVIHDADRIEAKHIHAIDQMLCQGEHEYAYEWDREKGCDDAMRDLLNVWLSNACKPKRPETEEEKHMRRLLDLLDSAPDYGVSF